MKVKEHSEVYYRHVSTFFCLQRLSIFNGIEHEIICLHLMHREKKQIKNILAIPCSQLSGVHELY